jgi:predicted transcriptional regulator
MITLFFFVNNIMLQFILDLSSDTAILASEFPFFLKRICFIGFLSEALFESLLCNASFIVLTYFNGFNVFLERMQLYLMLKGVSHERIMLAFLY